jgi:NADH-quinone oxidoreductase subunit A
LTGLCTACYNPKAVSRRAGHATVRPNHPRKSLPGEPAMVNAWVPILIYFVVAVGFGVVTLLLAWMIAPQRYSRVKLEPFECGIEPVTDARDRYSVRYFLVAMLFLIFDVETIFLYPWAVIVDELAWFGFIEVVVFLFILVVGYFYAWREGALEWA